MIILLTWNRDFTDAWPDADYQEARGEVASSGSTQERWSVGRHRNVPVGTECYLLTQGQLHPRGLVGRGVVTSEPYQDDHWHEPGKKTFYVDVDWYALLDADAPVPVADLALLVPEVHWLTGIKQSGTRVPESSESKLIEAWQASSPGASAPAEVREPAESLLRRLIGVDLTTVSRGMTNRIIGVNSKEAIVATERSPQGEPVPVADLAAALAILRQQGWVSIDTGLGHRSSFIGAVLRTLPGTATILEPHNPPRIELTSSSATPEVHGVMAECPETFEGSTDRPATAIERNEQASLRAGLLGSADHAPCAICGVQYPVRFLWASHIKLRKVCTEAERKDLSNVAMLACLLGCDALYESGFIAVGPDGKVLVSKAATEAPGLSSHVLPLSSRTCLAHRAQTSGYFEWHRANKYLG